MHAVYGTTQGYWKDKDSSLVRPVVPPLRVRALCSLAITAGRGCCISGGRDTLGQGAPLLISLSSSVLMLWAGFQMVILLWKSHASFLAVVGHRLIPARARSIANDLRINSRAVSIWAPACLDLFLGLILVLEWFVCKGPHSLSLLSAFLSLKSFFRLGRAIRVILPSASGGSAHMFVVYGYQGSGEDPHKLASLLSFWR